MHLPNFSFIDRLIFKQSKVVLNSEFSFSETSRLTKTKERGLLVAGGEQTDSYLSSVYYHDYCNNNHNVRPLIWWELSTKQMWFVYICEVLCKSSHTFWMSW